MVNNMHKKKLIEVIDLELARNGIFSFKLHREKADIYWAYEPVAKSLYLSRPIMDAFNDDPDTAVKFLVPMIKKLYVGSRSVKQNDLEYRAETLALANVHNEWFKKRIRRKLRNADEKVVYYSLRVAKKIGKVVLIDRHEITNPKMHIFTRKVDNYMIISVRPPFLQLIKEAPKKLESDIISFLMYGTMKPALRLAYYPLLERYVLKKKEDNEKIAKAKKERLETRRKKMAEKRIEDPEDTFNDEIQEEKEERKSKIEEVLENFKFED